MSLFMLKIWPGSRSSDLRLLVVVALLLLGVVHLYFYNSLPGWSEYRSSLAAKLQHHNHSDDVCGAFSGLERVVITVKTGATEAAEKIPTQLRTSLRCAPHVYVFSDMAQTIGKIHLYDALDTISAEVKDGNPDFDIYRKQQELGSPEKIVSALRNSGGSPRPEDSAPWILDKYKNLHIVEKAWALQPDMDWYLHIDADTYVIWPSLIAWMKRLDPSTESFLGSLSYIVDKPFAHGGSGLLLSNAATRNFAVTHNGTAARWDPRMRDNCCGDWVLAQALHEYGMEVKNSWPTINGETQDTIPFAADHWCQPVVTLHHVSPTQAEQFGKFEQQRKNKNAPVLYSEIFDDLIFDTIPESLTDWNNMSEDEAISGVFSAEDCARKCASNPDCFQSLFTGDACTLGTKSIKFGEKHKPEGGKTWQSSWNRTRIAAWRSKQAPCRKVTFPFQNCRFRCPS